jgi:ligand-binding SRPBCC domain-containing protein
VIHRIDLSATIDASLSEAWGFFSNPGNLRQITPPELDFTIVSQVPAVMYPGLMIEYRVRPLFGIPMTWLTEITQVREPHYFVDEQRVGPYAIWHHEHFFEPLPDGRTRVRDLVHYVLPAAPISELVHGLLVRPQLNRIFRHRETVMAQAPWKKANTLC